MSGGLVSCGRRATSRRASSRRSSWASWMCCKERRASFKRSQTATPDDAAAVSHVARLRRAPLPIAPPSVPKAASCVGLWPGDGGDARSSYTHSSRTGDEARSCPACAGLTSTEASCAEHLLAARWRAAVTVVPSPLTRSTARPSPCTSPSPGRHDRCYESAVLAPSAVTTHDGRARRNVIPNCIVRTGCPRPSLPSLPPPPSAVRPACGDALRHRAPSPCRRAETRPATRRRRGGARLGARRRRA